VDGVDVKTIGWEPTCACGGTDENGDHHPEATRPCIVLDPFIGSGTTAEVCIKHDRWCWGIDLSEPYLRLNAIPRIQGALLEIPAKAVLIGAKAEVVQGGSSLLRKG